MHVTLLLSYSSESAVFPLPNAALRRAQSRIRSIYDMKEFGEAVRNRAVWLSVLIRASILSHVRSTVALYVPHRLQLRA